jgi:hypothetical protein
LPLQKDCEALPVGAPGVAFVVNAEVLLLTELLQFEAFSIEVI